MTISSGWSLDFAGAPRRIAAVLGTALLGSMLVLPGTALAATYDPATDMGSMLNTTTYSGARTWWTAGYTGVGVSVAVIDTGVSPVVGLDVPGKVVYGPDLSLESQNPAFRNLDTNGHGTFMAGLIAGAATDYQGMAPGARIVSLKVGDADGGTDVSQVIAAINWVIQHRNDNGLNIRVLNLSYGTASRQGADVDPVSFAVEQAWKAGIVVVAAAGNAGYIKGSGSPCLADPAYNPFVIGVGGTDAMGTLAVKDDKVGTYSSTGAAGCKSPDFVAPGSHLQGLRVPNSWIDANHPEGVIDARFFRGSGTSQAAAVTSGAVALLLQKYPKLTPDQVKKYITTYTASLSSTIGYQQGKGELQLGPMLAKTPASYVQSLTASKGTGSLDLARGTDRMTDDGVTISGEVDIWGHAYNSAAMATAMAAGNTWSGGTWNGNTWSGNTWSGNTWSGNTWSGNSWSGNTWSGNTWSGNTWSGNTWSGNTWSGNSWSGNSWSGNSWATGSWN